MLKKFIIFAAIGAVVAGAAFALLSSDDNRGASPRPTSSAPGRPLGQDQRFSPTPVPDNGGRDPGSALLGIDPAPAPSGGSATPSGTSYLVAEHALRDSFSATTGPRVFGLPDGTVALLYHRAAERSAELHEIVMVHSHDGGKSWHGEIVVGAEAADATYTGILAPNGDLFVAYGRDAAGEAGGALHLNRLKYFPEEHGWRPGSQQRVVWDWPGYGAGAPSLAFTGTRLWLAYRYFEGEGYSIYVQYADPDHTGDYPEANWSDRFPLTEPTRDPELAVGLVSHGAQLSAFFNQGLSGIEWRRLVDPIGSPKEWLQPHPPFPIIESLFDPERQKLKFSVTSDLEGHLHLAFSIEGQIIGYFRWDGFEWSRFRQIAANNVSSPSLTSDGVTTWIFWNRASPSGETAIQTRRWNQQDGWERGTYSAWTQHHNSQMPSIAVYRSGVGNYSYITRLVAGQATFRGGIGIVQYLQRIGDMLVFSSQDRFSFLPLDARGAPLEKVAQTLQYWNGTDWAPLPSSAIQVQTSPAGIVSSSGPLEFTPPTDWQAGQVDGEQGYHIRLVWKGDVASFASVSFKAPSLLGEVAPGTVGTNVPAALWIEAAPGADGGRLWFGTLSYDGATSLTATPSEHVHDGGRITDPEAGAATGAADRPLSLPARILQLAAATRAATLVANRPVSLPPGSPTQYFQASLDVGQSHEFQLLDGQVRRVTLVDTRIDFRSPERVTVWATATVEVSGPGVQPQRAEVPAAYFQEPVVLNGVRVYVEATREFNDFRLSGGGTDRHARLMLSDARYSLTSLHDYRYPFGGMLWGLGPFDSYFLGLQGTASNPSHGSAFQQSMPTGTDIHVWKPGSLDLSLQQDVWIATLKGAEDQRQAGFQQVSPLRAVDLSAAGGPVDLGTRIGEVVASPTPAVKWGTGSRYDWAPALAEWYVAHSSPKILSFQKDWLVLGPFSAEDMLDPLSHEFLEDETAVSPQAGDPGPSGLAWKRYDGIVPGVVNVAEAVSDYPNSGWASINGNQPHSVAYFATYIHSPSAQPVTLNLGSSDAFKVWLNGDLVLDNPTAVRVRRSSDWSIIPDAFKEEVTLIQGWNRVLIKLSQRATQFTGPEAAQRAWQLTFRVSDQEGNPLSAVTVSPDRRLDVDPLAGFATIPDDPNAPRSPLASPPPRRHEWPEKVDLAVGESFTYTLLDGSQRTLKLLSYEVVIPRHRVEATIEVSGDGKRETHTLEVALAGVPVSINGLRVYAYAWKEANNLGFEQVGITGQFPLTQGKDVGFALSDASVTMYPDMDNFTYPFDIPLHGGADLQSWLEPAGDFEANAWAHAGYDIKASDEDHLVAMTDGVVWYSRPSSNDPQTIGQGMVWLATTSGDQYDDPRTWLFTHVLTGTALVPNGTFVKKGTPIARGGSHFGSRDSFDFGGWLFATEVWNYEHRLDFPVPRHWLVLGPFDGTMSDNYIAGNENRDLPADLQPQEGASALRGDKRWKFGDNFGNGVVALNELLSESPFSGYSDRWPTDSVAYAATYIFSPEDHTTNGKVYLRWGTNQRARVWLNGETILQDDASGAGRRVEIDRMRDPLPLRKGWNTLIIKSSTDSNGVWRISPRIGDAEGRRIPGIEFSTRDIALQATTVEGSSVNLQWSAPDFHGTFVETYKLDVAQDEGFKELVVDNLDIGQGTSYTVDGLEGGQRYYIRVKPFNSELGGTVLWRHVDSVSVTTGG